MRIRWLAGLALVLVAAGVWWWAPHRPSGQARLSLAVLGFESLAPQPEGQWLTTALTETLVTELSAGGELRLIPGETIARMSQQFAPDKENGPQLAAASRLGEILNTDFVVDGTYQLVRRARDRQLRLEVRLRETDSGETLAEIERTGSEMRFFELVSAIASELRQVLEVKDLSFVEQRSVRATYPANLGAFRFYLDGLNKLRSFDALAARESLVEAVTLDPTYAIAYASLSRAWSTLGYDLEAESSGRRAYELVADLPEEVRLRIEGRYFEAAAEWGQAIRTYETLWQLFPDSVDDGLRLAEAQVMAGRGQEGLSTIDRLRTLPSLGEIDPRIDLTEASAANSLSDYRKQLSAAQRAAQKALAAGASSLTADALQSQGEAYFQLLETEAATASFQEARGLFEAAGDRGKLAQVLSRIADVLSFEKKTAEAFALYREALVIHRQTGDRKGVSQVQNSMAFQLYQQGDLKAARTMLEEAVAIGREIGDRIGEADYLDTLIDVLVREGDLKAAWELALEERAIYRELGNREGLAWSIYYLGNIALAGGDVRRALSLHDQALVISDEVSNPYLTAFVLDALAKSLLADGDVVGAFRMATDSRNLRSELGFNSTLAQSQITAASILLEKGRPGEAEVLAREAVEVLEDNARMDDAAIGGVTLFQALMDQGRIADAGRVIERLRGHAENSQNPTVRLSVAVAESELLAAAGNSGAGIRRLGAVVTEAHQLGLIKLELEARLVLGTLEIRRARGAQAATAPGRQRLDALAKKAWELGFGLIARKAGGVLGASGSQQTVTPGIRITDVW